MNPEHISIAEAKKSFSDLLGRVAYGHKKIVITKRGRPIALLSPVEEGEEKTFQFKGWLDEGDPFFETVDRIVQERVKHRPRRVKGKK
jgi:prevent-host-death family protein